MLIFWSTVPGSSMCKVLSIFYANLYCSTGIKSKNGYEDKQSRYMSLILVAISKTREYHLKKHNMICPGDV